MYGLRPSGLHDKRKGCRGGPGRWPLLCLVLPLLAAGCGLNPFADDKPRVMHASAAGATMQTYRELMAEAGLTGPSAQEAAAAASEARAPASDVNGLAGRPTGSVRQVAALPPADEPRIAVRVDFPPGKGALSAQDESDLGALAAQLLREEKPPIEILAYWSGDEDEASTAKLYALKRAMEVRRFLVGQGLEPAPIVFTQVEERETPPALVDVVLVRR